MAVKHVWAMSLVLFAVTADYVGVTMMRVALPFYAKSLGGSSTLIGSLETGYGIGQWVGATTLPRLSDVWGRRRVMMLCCLFSAVGYTLALVSIIVASPTLLLLSRVPVGLAKQTVTISRAVVADCTDANEDRSRWMAFQCTALAIGCTLGPLLASKASEYLGDMAPVATAAAMFMVLAPMVAITFPETAPTSSGEGKLQESGPPLWQNRQVLFVLFLLALPELGLISHQGVALNTYCVQYLGMDKAWIANLNASSAAFQATFAATICVALSSRGWTDVALLQLGSGLFAIASLSIWWGQSSKVVFWSAPAAAAANSVLRTYPAALLSKHVPEQRQGAAMGLLDVCSSALRVAAPMLSGICMDQFGGPSIFLCQFVLFISAGSGFSCLRRPTAKVISSCASPKKGA